MNVFIKHLCSFNVVKNIFIVHIVNAVRSTIGLPIHWHHGNKIKTGHRFCSYFSFFSMPIPEPCEKYTPI